MRGLGGVGAALVVGGALALGLTACTPDVTAPRLAGSVAPTFANLYVLQQGDVGHRIVARDLDARAACHKGLPSQPDVGAGDDWACSVTWLADGPGSEVVALYTLHVQTDGCYSADGAGPLAVNEQQTVEGPGGRAVTNPLFAFDGCFATG